MIDIILSISAYIIAAILLGFIFGWFIAKAIFKEKYEEQLEVLSSNYDINKHAIDTQSKSQEKEIAALKDEIRILKEKHEQELEAFIKERIDITKKYKKLLDKIQNK